MERETDVAKPRWLRIIATGKITYATAFLL